MATVLALGILAWSKRADDRLGGSVSTPNLRHVLARHLLFSAARSRRAASSASTSCAIFP